MLDLLLDAHSHSAAPKLTQKKAKHVGDPRRAREAGHYLLAMPP